MRTRRAPNIRLRSLLREAHWTGQALADAVNTVGAESGAHLHYDRTTVAHWLTGARPAPPVARYVAEGLTRRLGRVITLDDLGFAPPHTNHEPTSAPGPINPGASLETLVGAPTDPSTAPVGFAYSLAATQLPSFGELPPLKRLTLPEPGRRVDACHVRLATLMLDVFADTDTAHGGGRARHALARFLATTVAPWLRAPAAPGVHTRLCAAAADLAYLAGFMSFDDNLHDIAQRYYTTAAQLATAAGDRVRYALALRAMSVQAHALHHHTQALHLADAAVTSAAAHDLTLTAFLHGQLAVAHAAIGETHAALLHLTTAHRHLDRATSTHPIGAYHLSALAHQHADVLTSLGQLPAAADQLARSLGHRPAGERRARAITTATLTQLRLRMGHLEHACTHGHAFLDDLPHLDSARADTALSTLRTSLRPYANTVPAAKELLRRLDTFATRHVRPRDTSR
ncbi:hypothetical protein ACIRL2_42465 [Embleya sp. NPDC127516]|uniref:hypothetical protein n=1 Tax=Embleya sp. NPDC127516 TaxID=3363990 RepID=UPI00382058CC